MALVAARAVLRSSLLASQMKHRQACAKAFSKWRMATSRGLFRTNTAQTRSIGNHLCHDALQNLKRSFSSAISATLEHRAVPKRSMMTPEQDRRPQAPERRHTDGGARDQNGKKKQSKLQSASAVLRSRRVRPSGKTLALRLRRRLAL